MKEAEKSLTKRVLIIIMKKKIKKIKKIEYIKKNENLMI